LAQHFYPVTIANARKETADCVSIAFDVPELIRDKFVFAAGQYVNVRAIVGDRELRRSYSLCSTPHSGEWRVAIKRVDGGQFSQWANALLREGDDIEIMPPDGRFLFAPEPSQKRNVLLLAAGSGITPILSILTTLLEREPLSRVTLVYGNRRVRDIIFKEAIEDLRDRYLTRFQLIHCLSGEAQESPLANGRLDGNKAAIILSSLLQPSSLDAVYVCGPNEMIESCAAAAISAGVPLERVHKELFGSPALKRPLNGGSEAKAKANANDQGNFDSASVTVIADGIERVLQVPYRGTPVLEVALAVGIDAPYACRAGVCSTCRARVLEGEVTMDANFTLEPHEVNRGFVLTCQSHPVSEHVRITFDER
jgi:ring-1,2-phenylacetyl-CoA epoxidase subunit PaaE